MARVTTTDLKDFKPIGRRGDYTWETLRDRLVRELGREYATLLAEPVTEPGWGRVDWHSDGAGQPRRISDLDPAAATELLDQLHAMRVAVDALAARIESQRDGDRGLAAALRRATVVPDESRFVWSAGGKPLLVNWGMVYVGDERTEATLIGEGLLRRPRAAAAASVAAAAVPSRPLRRLWPWAALLWLLFVGLMGIIYFLLLQACGIIVAPEDSVLRRFLPAACHASAAVDPYAAERGKRAELERKIRNAELDLARLQGDCTPPEPPPPPPQRRAEVTPPPPPAPPPPQPQPEPPPGPSIEKKLETFRAQTGELQISLSWHGLEDIDLHVKCPGGELYHADKSACGGTLDIDMNNGVTNVDAVENMVWANPPSGSYEVIVEFYARKGEPERTIPFEVRVKRGDSVQKFNGSVSTEKERRVVHAFTL